jgi:hypothetical protein
LGFEESAFAFEESASVSALPLLDARPADFVESDEGDDFSSAADGFVFFRLEESGFGSGIDLGVTEIVRLSSSSHRSSPRAYFSIKSPEAPSNWLSAAPLPPRAET